MDVVELLMTVDVTAAGNLMGSKRSGKPGVTVEEVKGRDSIRVSFIASSPMERPRSYLNENRTSNASESASWVKYAESEFWTEGVQSQRKVEKMVQGGGSRSKRLRTSQLVEFVIPKGTEELKGCSEKLGSRATKLMSPEQRLLLKQKSKRSAWKSSKFHTKAKFNSSSQKLCSTSFQSASVGKTFSGLYGLKSENQDTSEHIDDIPLNELLSGTYNPPSLSKNNGENGANANGSFLSAVRKACSLLQARKHTQSQNVNEMNDSVCPLTPVPPVDGGLIEDKQQSSRIDALSDPKASCSKAVTPSLLDWPLHPPKDVLEHLALPPPRDLESLLLDATKPSVFARTNDSRSSKQIARRPILPAFTWSHGFTGHCRASSDSVKLSSSRSICQGRWARILNITSCAEVAGGGFLNLDLLIYDRSLVPSNGVRIPSMCYKGFPSVSVTCPISLRDTCAILSNDSPHVTLDEYNPRTVAAAQILYEIANQSSWFRTNGMLRCQKKWSKKTVKACNRKPDYKFEETLRTSIAMNGSEQARYKVQRVTAKKPRLMTFENRGSQLFNGVKKGAGNWPASRSSRSIHGKAARVSNMEDKCSISSANKQSFTMHPPGKDSNKAGNCQRKLGKLVLMDWKEGRDRWR